jgi:hypothetical protein
VSEEQVAQGFLETSSCKALLAMGCSALPAPVHKAIKRFVHQGGLLIADYAPALNDSFQPLHRTGLNPRPRLYTLPDGVPVTVQVGGASLLPPQEAQVVARFDDGSPAICRSARGQGAVVLVGSYLGWDYSNYPGYTDLAEMFPFHIRRDEAVRRWLAATLDEAGIVPPIRSTHPDVEAALWVTADRSEAIVIVINHLQEVTATTLQLPGEWAGREVLTDQPVQWAEGLHVTLNPLEGRAFRLNKR